MGKPGGYYINRGGGTGIGISIGLLIGAGEVVTSIGN